MKKTSLVTFVLLILSTMELSAQLHPKAEINLDDELDSISYALGMNMGQGLQQAGVDSVDMEKLARGIQDVITNSTMITQEEANAMLQKYFSEVRMKQQAAAMHKEREYMIAHKNGEGVNETKTGLQYKIITAGTGAIPSNTDTVKVHYTGKLISGKVFDSSVQRGQPAEFPVNRVIAGWTEALTMMPVGSKWELTIPSRLAYGDRGTAGIPPHSVLIFEVELLDIVNQ